MFCLPAFDFASLYFSSLRSDCFILCTGGFAATDTDYLQQIEAAAKRQAITPITHSTQPNRATTDGDRIPEGLQS
ncbi:MAG: hypothetical protein R3F37_16990 [Candidatus Competibacteraceae bacterium]